MNNFFWTSEDPIVEFYQGLERFFMGKATSNSNNMITTGDIKDSFKLAANRLDELHEELEAAKVLRDQTISENNRLREELAWSEDLRSAMVKDYNNVYAELNAHKKGKNDLEESFTLRDRWAQQAFTAYEKAGLSLEAAANSAYWYADHMLRARRGEKVELR